MMLINCRAYLFLLWSKFGQWLGLYGKTLSGAGIMSLTTLLWTPFTVRPIPLLAGPRVSPGGLMWGMVPWLRQWLLPISTSWWNSMACLSSCWVMTMHSSIITRITSHSALYWLGELSVTLVSCSLLTDIWQTKGKAILDSPWGSQVARQLTNEDYCL